MSAQCPKHRACDECRARKLACSKEADGCRRCRRENIVCVYSAQRKMGRPRKQERLEAGAEVRVADPADAVAVEPTLDLKGLQLQTDQVHMTFWSLLGLDMSSGSEDLADLAELADPMPGGPVPAGSLQLSTPPEDQPPSGEQQLSPPAEHPPPDWMNLGVGTPLSEFLLEGELPGLEGQLQPQLTSLPPLPGSCLDDLPSRRCDCLARLYLALDSLQTLPGDVIAALLVARNATHAAHDTVQCTSCAMAVPTAAELASSEPVTIPPIQAMQSLMLLGALLPSIAHAYRRILTLVDSKAAWATAMNQKLPLAVHACGGIWGWLASLNDRITCNNGKTSMLEPLLWRNAVRSMMRMDVYGIHADPEMFPCTGLSSDDICAAGDGPLQLGLKHIVEIMETRSRARHASLDAAVAAGLMHNAEARGYVRLQPGEKHQCQTIIAMARREIDRLVIA